LSRGVDLRTWIERVPAVSRSELVEAIERWKGMRRSGWELSVLHRHRPSSSMIAFGFLRCGRKSRWASGC